MKRIVLSTVLLLIAQVAIGQHAQAWQNEEFMHHTINPALLGHYQDLQISVQYTRKWDRLSSSPSGINALVAMPFAKDRMGIGLALNRSQIGPISSSGISLQYAYAFPLGLGTNDQFAMGLSANIQQMRFEQGELLPNQSGDALITGMEDRSAIPPNLNIGFHYSTADASYDSPISLQIGGALARYIPFGNRFNTLVYSRPHQVYLRAGISHYLDEQATLSGQFLVSDTGPQNFQSAVRLNVEHDNYGWITLQYGNRQMFLTQAGVRLKLNDNFDDALQIVGSYGWSFGTVGAQLGNGLSIGLSYRRSLN